MLVFNLYVIRFFNVIGHIQRNKTGYGNWQFVFTRSSFKSQKLPTVSLRDNFMYFYAIKNSYGF